jgi:hypothetical protein
MRAFALNDYLAALIVRLRYDPLKASAALLGVSNTLHEYGAGREAAQRALEKELGFRTVI